MKKVLLSLLILAVSVICLAIAYPNTNLKKKAKKEIAQEEFKTGDLVFQDSESRQSQAIKLATQSQFSHVGIIILNGETPYVLEAVEPVRIISFEEWKNNGSNGNYTLTRLKQAKDFDADKIESFKKKHLNKHYDLGFYWSDEKMYCSELAFKFYSEVLGIELCEKHQLKEYSTDYPEVRKIMKQRYGNNIPWDEWMVSPEDLFKSTQMRAVR
jgi:hypothetical protein